MKEIKIGGFLKSDFRDFSLYDCQINIPNLVDGLKVSQRKVIWTVLNNPKTITVEQMSALASAYTKYHHGAVSLSEVIVKLAQSFTGSNNVNWMTPDGQFGNILSHTASSPRYISTSLNSNWRQWFKKDDDIVLEYEIEDGEITEPKFFIPLVPTILFNGSSGIGTGYACSIFAYDPKDVVECVKKVIANKEQPELIPHYKGYLGKIEKVNGQTIYHGAYEKVNSTAIRITQLPIGYDLTTYKEVLVKLIESGEIKDFDDHSTEDKWDIIVYANREWIKQHESILIEKLKLITKDTENIVVWDENQRIRRFDNPNQLVSHFVQWRLGIFEQRRVKQISIFENDLKWLTEKKKFIQYFIENSKRLVNLNKQELFDDLTEKGFVEIDKLMNIKLYNLTKEEIDKLNAQIEDTENEIRQLHTTNAKEMFLSNLKSIKV